MSVTLGFSFDGIKSLFAIKPRRQLREMYVFLLLFSFAAALITVFEPIFFYTLGIPLWKICLYYALHYVLYALAMPLGGMFAARFGYERSLTLSTPIFVLYFLLLASLAQHESLFWLALVVLTGFKILYWPAYHANFASYTDQRNGGTEQSWVRLVEFGVGVLGPVLGGVIAQKFGFPALFLLTGITVALAGLALLRTKERSRMSTFRYVSGWQIIFSRRHRHMVVSMIGWGENLVYLAIWPVFMMIAFGDVEKVGLVASINAIVATFLGFGIGELTDRISPRRMLRWAVLYVAFGYIARLFFFLPWQVAIGDVLARTATAVVGIPFIARLYKQARGAGPLEYAVAFETVLALVKAIGAFILVAVFIFFPLPIAFVIAFAMAAVLSLFYAAL